MRLTDCDTNLVDMCKHQWYELPNTRIKGMLMYDMPMIHPNYVLRCAYRDKHRPLTQIRFTILLDNNFVSEDMSRVLRSLCGVETAHTKRKCKTPSAMDIYDFNLYNTEDNSIRSACIHINNYISNFWDGVYHNDIGICTIRYNDLYSYNMSLLKNDYYSKIFEDFLKK